MASSSQNIYHATKPYVRAFSIALSVELLAYPGITNTQLMPGPVHTQFVTRAHVGETVMMGVIGPGALEDPKAVAMAGYRGLCKGKREVFSSWNAAANPLMMKMAPRSVGDVTQCHKMLRADNEVPLESINYSYVHYLV
jgi:short-subunit dehydrogenase